MSKHWKPGRTRWLSPEAYKALGAQERRALQAERARAKRKPSTIAHLYPARRRTTRRDAASFAVTLVGAIAAGVAIAAYQSGVVDVPDLPAFSQPATTPVTASFSYCKWGGGTNCVVDGDTFYLNGDKVRIAGIDTPETHPPRCASEAELGERAARQLQALLNSGAVTMTSIDRDRDTYGRLLRNVSVNGADVGEALIAAGLAREYGSGRRSWC